MFIFKNIMKDKQTKKLQSTDFISQMVSFGEECKNWDLYVSMRYIQHKAAIQRPHVENGEEGLGMQKDTYSCFSFFSMKWVS